MSTRGPQRWCSSCRGQVYFHHAAHAGDVVAGVTLPVSIDIWYCQGCGHQLAEDEVLSIPDQPAKVKAKNGRPNR